MADELPELYSWAKKILIQANEASSQPESDVSLYIGSDDDCDFSTNDDIDCGYNSSKKAEDVRQRYLKSDCVLI